MGLSWVAVLCPGFVSFLLETRVSSRLYILLEPQNDGVDCTHLLCLAQLRGVQAESRAGSLPQLLTDRCRVSIFTTVCV